jgi:DNA-binding MarR family transcriptional regulator
MRTAELLRFLVLAVQREGNRQLATALRAVDLTPSQAEAVRVIGQYGPLSLQNVGELLVCESGTNPSRLIDRLVDAGLVLRQTAPDDRRRVTLSLTAEGKRAEGAVRAIEQSFYERLDTALAGVDLEPSLALLRSLAEGTSAGDSLRHRLEREQSSPG